MNVRRLAPAGALAAILLATLGCSATADADPHGSAPAAATPAASAKPPAPADRPLRTVAAATGVRIGTAVDVNALKNDALYERLVGQEFNTVTPENAMKWESVEPQRGVYTWEQADALVDYARAHDQLVRGHTLIWHNQNPSWLTDGNFSTAELRAILKEHIATQMRHFKGRIWAWDVANEVIDDSGQLRSTFWLQKLGPGYIADAFRWAHQADPKAILFLNDYNVEGINDKSTAYYNLIKDLLKQGVPVRGFGIQGHLDVRYSFPADVQANLNRFGQLGLKTALTEVDVRITLPVDATESTSQAYAYNSLLTACLLARGCISYTVWGYTDKYSWVPGVFAGQGEANLLDGNFQPKPAYDALKQTLTQAGARK
ncbi:endo-1,4-beta-xylanase [Rhizomonospora bruguierae]|uniref:endo-1,4-beta-xylanase n=1 Tax=Rhizomonospora bruguierae TaxID=1581705 RepID=UPI001BD094AE|nr:endo-1,4-beta-xylanase [Micromonospora sp. NBRC 107566]